MDNVNEQECRVCKGKGEYEQTYTIGCGYGSYQSVGRCDYCGGTGKKKVEVEATPPSPSTASEVDERAAFEAWAKVEYRNVEHYGVGDYDTGFAAWKAGRAALASNPATTTEGAGERYISIDENVEFQFRLLDLMMAAKKHAPVAVQSEKIQALVDIIDSELVAASGFRAQGGNTNDSIPPEAWMRLGAMKEQARATGENVAELKAKYGLVDPDRAAKPADSEAK